MSITPGRRALLLLLGGLLLVPPRPAAAENDAGVRRAAAEALARRRFVIDLVPRLVRQDDELVTLGFDDPLRQRRINRLLGMGENLFSAGAESTAVAAACLDRLRLDPGLSATPLAPDIAKAADYALQALLPLVPRLQTAVGGEWSALRKLARFDAAPSPAPDPAFADFPNPYASPVVLDERMDRRAVLLETPPREVEARGSSGFAWIPGSELLVTWGAAGVAIVDTDHPASVKTLTPERFDRLQVSASGEYLAGARFDRARGASVLELYRLIGDSAAIVVDQGARIGHVTFSPRGLGLAYTKDGRVLIADIERGTAPRAVASLDSVIDGGLGWSPDSRRLMVVGVVEKNGARGGTRLVLDAMSGAEESRWDDVRPWPVAWTPDSRSFAVLDSSESGVRISLETLDGTSGVEAPALYRAPAGVTPVRAAWSLNGRYLAVVLAAEATSGAARPGASGPFPPAPDPGDFIAWETTVAIEQTAAPKPGTPLDPPAASAIDLAWHPGGEWYTAERRAPTFGPALWVANARTRDAFPVGRGGARHPLFSSDGRRLAWFEDGGAERLFVQDLEPSAPAAARARTEAQAGLEAARHDKAVAAVRRYRNAIRLAPGDGRAYQGLGNACLEIAGALRDPWQKGYFLEAASRALFSAYELGGRSPDVRVGFLDAIGRRAVLAGRRRAAAFTVAAEDRLRDLPAGGYGRVDGLEDVARDLTDAVLWDPWDEHDRALLEGTLVRLAWKNPSDPDDVLKRSRN